MSLEEVQMPMPDTGQRGVIDNRDSTSLAETMEIIIVGAGIAGLSAGIGLRRAGHKVTVGISTLWQFAAYRPHDFHKFLTCRTNKILEQSSLLHEVGAAITVKPNATRVLESWDFDPEESGMVVIRGLSMIDGTNMQTLIPTYYKDCESTWGLPMYAVHRVDLHTQLRRLATEAKGPGRPCDVRTLAKVVDYDAEKGKITTENGEVLQADLIVAADGVHSKAVKHVLGEDETETLQVGDTGWACMRWLTPTNELLADPETAHLIQESHFRAAVKPNVPLEYAKKHFTPAMHAVFGKARDVKFWKLVARGPIPKWHKDRLVLIGEAAHPMLTCKSERGLPHGHRVSYLTQNMSTHPSAPKSEHPVDSGGNEYAVQGQGGGQAIEDGAALGILLDQIRDLGAIEERLQLFEQVRRNRGSALQILSNTNPPAPPSVREAAVAYFPTGTRLDSTDDINDYVFSFDVVGECKAALAAA
ncbi:MAG: hypothetical protein M1821_002498 [Bathelium mastoideum]|nr:MAG: hypothetical protein M1821_002498 [Bathelium mastoideum]